MTTDDEANRPQGLLEGEEHREVVVLEEAGESEGPYEPGTFVKVGSAIATLALAIAATYVVPALAWARPWTSADPVPFWNIIGREFLGEGEAVAEVEAREEATDALAQHVLADDAAAAPIADKPIVAPPKTAGLPPYQPQPGDDEVPTQAIELPDATALDGFLGRLAKSDAGYAGAVTRVVHWGDSVVAADHVTSAVRTKMQQRFGDAGHGFILVAKPNSSYIKKGIEFRGGDDWQRCYIINKCKSDGRYGLGGTTVWSSGGAESRFSTSDSTPNGRKASKLELWYVAQPKGGNVRVKVDDDEPIVVSTAGDTIEDRWQTIDVPDGPHTFQVRAAGGGSARLYGVVVERDVPGVVWDGMAQLGAFTSRMLYFDAEHIRDQIAHRDPGLLVFMFGGNDLLLSANRLDEYEDTFREMLKRFRAQADPPDCLVMSPVDHGIRESQRIVSNPMVAKITEVQRKVAMEQGCGFFDTQAAMGGAGAVARWRKSNPPRISGDLAHLTDAGQKVLGHMLYVAIVQRYVEYRARKG